MHAKDYGVMIDGNISYDWPLMMKRKNLVVKRLTTGVAGLLKKNGVTVVSGFGKVLSPNQVEVNGEIYETKDLIIATGAVQLSRQFLD